MNKGELIERITYYLQNSQVSERFAMYRLITPVVDYANAAVNYDVYFEYNQTSSHKTPQSVDIALLVNDVPLVMIEAKRLNRKLSAEQVNKYLKSEMRGIVTDGENWVLCFKGKNKNINILNRNETVSVSALDEIISFIQLQAVDINLWTDEIIYYKSTTKPKKQKKKSKAVRKIHETTEIKKLISVNDFIVGTKKITELEKELLRSIFSKLESNKNVFENIFCEFRETRVSFFFRQKRKRFARIEFGKKQPDMIFLTNLVVSNNSITKIAKPEPHDKGKHMRRFRLYNKKQTIEFGYEIAKIIIKI